MTVFSHPHSKKKCFLTFRGNLSFQFVPIAPGSVTAEQLNTGAADPFVAEERQVMFLW